MKIRVMWPILMIMAVVIALPGCSNSDGEKTGETAVNVEVQKINCAAEGEQIAYSGTIEEAESVSLSFLTMGTIQRVCVKEGDFVKKGTLLAVINDESHKNAYDMSLASLKQAEDAYKRLQPMYKNGNLPEIKLVEVETSLQQARAAVAIAKKNLDDCKLYSAADGMVGRKSVETGMSVMPGVPVFTIVKIHKVFAKVSVPENEIANIKNGEKANVIVGALNNQMFQGSVEEIGVMADPIAHSYKIKIGIMNNSYSLKPGMICNVGLLKGKKLDGFSVPTNAVSVDNLGNSFVFTVDMSKNRAVRKMVKTGALLREGIMITGGLNEGDLIVVTGIQKLADNALVHILNR